MIRRLWMAAGAFVIVLVLHAAYIIWHTRELASQWALTSRPPVLMNYFSGGEIFLGLSYATAAGFTVYALLQTLQGRKGGALGALGGITWTGLLYFGGCFLLGCCGSPMLGVYAGLFGSRFLGAAKPLVFVLTVISVLLGGWWLQRRAKTKGLACCREGCCDG